jgi:hypothetical protein
MSIHTSRASDLADQYSGAVSALLKVVEACTPAQWQMVCINEQRTVGVLVHHLAVTSKLILGAIGEVAAGRPAPQFTQEQVDHQNARHAQENAHVEQAETLALLRENSGDVVGFLRDVSDADLERTGTLPIIPLPSVSAGQLVEFLLIGHTLGHLASIQTALGD